MKNLKKLRFAKGFSQKSFAKMIGVTASMIVRYESGNVYPRLDIAIRIAKALECTVEELVE